MRESCAWSASARASADLDPAFEWITRRSPEAARRWYARVPKSRGLARRACGSCHCIGHRFRARGGRAASTLRSVETRTRRASRHGPLGLVSASELLWRDELLVGPLALRRCRRPELVVDGGRSAGDHADVRLREPSHDRDAHVRASRRLGGVREARPARDSAAAAGVAVPCGRSHRARPALTSRSTGMRSIKSPR